MQTSLGDEGDPSYPSRTCSKIGNFDKPADLTRDFALHLCNVLVYWFYQMILLDSPGWGRAAYPEEPTASPSITNSNTPFLERCHGRWTDQPEEKRQSLGKLHKHLLSSGPSNSVNTFARELTNHT